VQQNSSSLSRLLGRKRVLLAEKEAAVFVGGAHLLLFLTMTMKTMMMILLRMENKDGE